MLKSLFKLVDFWIFITLLAILLFRISITNFFLYSTTSDILTVSKSTVSSIFDSVSSVFKDYINVNSLKNKYNETVQELIISKLKIASLESSNLEIQRLKEALNFKKRYLSINLIPIKQIQNRFTFNKKVIIAKNITKDKLRVDQGVITEYGVVGIISDISGETVTIIPTTHPKSSIPVWVGDKKIFAFVSGKDNEQSLSLKLKYVEDSSRINNGDKIVTNGFGDIFPEGLIVGYVKDVEIKRNSLFVEIVVQFPKNIYSSKYLYVIKK